MKPVAPAKFAFTQGGFEIGGKFYPPMDMYNLTDDIPGHPKDSTVSARTLVNKGYDLPPRESTMHSNPDKIRLDDIKAELPPIYSLLSLTLLTHARMKHVFRVKDPVRITGDPVHQPEHVFLNNWTISSFHPRTALGVDLGFDARVLIAGLAYEILVIGQDGPSIRAHYEHQFKAKVVLHGSQMHRVGHGPLIRGYAALEHLPKLPHGWKYLQFIG